MTRPTERPVTGPLAEFTARLRIEDVPETDRRALDRLLLDGFANLVAGARNEPARIQHELVAEAEGRSEATVVATGLGTSIPSAAMLNVLHANMLDFDDTYRTFAHPGAMSIGPALACAEARAESGATTLAAIVAGYETQLRIIEGGMPTPERRRTIWGFGVWQSVGAVAASARALGLDVERTRHAFGVGLFNAPVPNIPKMGLGDAPSAWSKNNYAWAAAGAVTGSLLAERGYRGNPDIFDGEGAFYLMAGSDRFDPDTVLDGLGEQYRFARTSLKPYAACRWAHGALDALGALRTRLGDAVADAARVEVALFRDGAVGLRGRHPRGILEAQFSMAHLAALELLGRSPCHGMREEDFVCPEVVAFADRVELVHDPALDTPFEAGRLPARVTAFDAAGSTLAAAETADAWGSAEWPMSDEEAWRKFLGLVEPEWGRAGAQRLADGVLGLSAVTDVRAWLRELVAASRGTAKCVN
ncbi:MAG: MmgE/PrpD family protein [Microbacteriaceae bacterium]